MTKTSVLFHLEDALRFIMTFLTSSSGFSLPRPIPAKLWIVVPPMLQAAIPVEAVTATASGRLTCLLRRSLMICLRRTDLPVPALPVKKTDCPDMTSDSTARCSGDRVTWIQHWHRLLRPHEIGLAAPWKRCSCWDS